MHDDSWSLQISKGKLATMQIVLWRDSKNIVYSHKKSLLLSLDESQPCSYKVIYVKVRKIHSWAIRLSHCIQYQMNKKAIKFFKKEPTWIFPETYRTVFMSGFCSSACEELANISLVSKTQWAYIATQGRGHTFAHENKTWQIGTYQCESYLRDFLNFKNILGFSLLNIISELSSLEN